MTKRDQEMTELDDLSPKYDGYVDQAIEYAESRLSAQDAAAFRQRMKTDTMFRRVVEPVLESWNEPALTPSAFSDHWQKFRQRVADKGGVPVPSADPFHEDYGGGALESWGERLARRIRRNPRLLLRFAAVAVLMVGAPTAFWVYLELTYFETISMKPNVTATVKLPDESLVQLAPGSSVRYLKKMAEKQTRWADLEGDGTFIVTPVAGKTFVVETNVANVTVLGTRFNVLATDASTRVLVLDGLVSVQPLDDRGKPRGSAVTLAAGGRVLVTTAGIVDSMRVTKP